MPGDFSSSQSRIGIPALHFFALLCKLLTPRRIPVARVLGQLKTLEAEAGRLLPAVARKATQYRLELETQYDAVFGTRPLGRA